MDNQLVNVFAFMCIKELLLFYALALSLKCIRTRVWKRLKNGAWMEFPKPIVHVVSPKMYDAGIRSWVVLQIVWTGLL